VSLRVQSVLGTLYYKRSLTQYGYGNDPLWRDPPQGQELRLHIVYCLGKTNHQSALSIIYLHCSAITNRTMPHVLAFLLG
jgi:hypothetical protein